MTIVYGLLLRLDNSGFDISQLSDASVSFVKWSSVPFASTLFLVENFIVNATCIMNIKGKL